MVNADNIDNVIGILANFFAVAAILSAILVRMLTARRKATVAAKFFKGAEWAASHSMLQWLKVPAKRASRLMQRHFGRREKNTSYSLKGMLSAESWYASTRLAAIYLTFGIPMLGLLYLAAAPSMKINFSGRVVVLAFLIILALAVWAAKLLTLKGYVTSVNSKVRLFFRTLIIGIAIPAFITGGGYVDAQAYASNPPTISGIIFVVGFIGFVAVTYLYTTTSLLSIFRQWLPFGLVIYLFSSLFVARAATNITGSDSTLDLVGMSLLIFGSFNFERWLKGSARNVASAFGATGLLLLALPLFYSIYTLGVDAILQPIYQENSIITFHLVFGTFVVTVASLVYSNGLCDWLSVAITRLLILSLLKSKSYVQYVTILIIDGVLAVVLCILTYVLFVALTHLYYLAAQLPLGNFLQELRNLPMLMMTVEPSAGQVSSVNPDIWTTIGKAIGHFVLLFALTAAMPTLFHLVLTVIFVAGRIISLLLAEPASALLEKNKEVLGEGESSVRALHKKISFVTLIAVMFFYI